MRRPGSRRISTRKRDGKLLINEINVIPDFTRIRVYPKMCVHSGLPYPKLLERLIALAFANSYPFRVTSSKLPASGRQLWMGINVPDCVDMPL
jgi:hypothetical protein